MRKLARQLSSSLTSSRRRESGGDEYASVSGPETPSIAGPEHVRIGAGQLFSAELGGGLEGGAGAADDRQAALDSPSVAHDPAGASDPAPAPPPDGSHGATDRRSGGPNEGWTLASWLASRAVMQMKK